MVMVLVALLLVVAAVNADVYFQDDFNDGLSKWTESTNKGDEAGKWKVTAGKFYGDEKEDIGMQTSEDARFYQISAPLDKEFSNKGKDLVIQYSVKHEQNIDCGGAYVKLLPKGLDQGDFSGDSDYNIMFGPDICGGDKKTHLIFTYKGKNHLIKDQLPCESDDKSHLYTLILKDDNTYTVKIDGEEKRTGSLKEDWDMLLPAKIDDPKESKPEDWDDRQKIPDPEDIKPDGWDDIPERIADADAEQPEDWDDELDGDWTAPMVDNPEYKGDWHAKLIDNPAYKGEWVHPQIDNPDYEDDDELYAYDSHAFIGIEVWQVKSGTIFDRFLVTDDVEAAAKAAEAFLDGREAEDEMAETVKEAEREAAEAEREAEREIAEAAAAEAAEAADEAEDPATEEEEKDEL